MEITAEMKNKIKQAKQLILDVFDAADTSGENSERYAQMFATMSDEEFYNMCKRRLPFRMEQKLFKIEPTMTDIFNAFKVLDKPLIERIRLPYLYRNEDGEAIDAQESLVIYVHLKRMKQMLVEKNSTAMEINKRDMAGMLVGSDKGGKQTDREFESLAAMGLEFTMDEFARPRADAMKAKAEMYNNIASQGFVRQSDLTVEKDDSLAKNMLNVYLLGANIKSNLVDQDYLTPYTIRNRQRK